MFATPTSTIISQNVRVRNRGHLPENTHKTGLFDSNSSAAGI